MDTNGLIVHCESLNNDTERIIKYCAIINYVEALQKSIGFQESEEDWRNVIHAELMKDINNSINDFKKEIKKIISFYINAKQ